MNSVKTVGNGEICETLSLFVVGLQEMVKQKYKNVPRKTIHQTENKYLEFVLNISPVSFIELLPLQILYIFVSSDGDVSSLTTDQFKLNSVNTVENGERCEIDTTTCMVK
jgi:hypothetical protein